MKISFENLGTIRSANLELGDLTILCGRNNTGKTYITYATYGFLDFWHSASIEVDLPKNLINNLKETGACSILIEDLMKDEKKILARVSKAYSRLVPQVLSGRENLFQKSSVVVELPKSERSLVSEEQDISSLFKKKYFKIEESEDRKTLVISLLTVAKNTGKHDHFLEEMIREEIFKILFKNRLPRPFIASAERTGSVIFQRELDFTRNRLIDLIGDKNTKISSAQLLGKFSAEYPVPVRRNVDFIRELPNIINKESIFLKKYPKVLEFFSKIIGGEYRISKNGELLYVPASKKNIKLTMVESSSAVRSLLDVGCYIKHIAQEGDLLIVDEPELNLHPENQRLMARLFAMLVNCGIKVFITTHSDYIIRELNTLLLLNEPANERLKAIADKEGYSKEEFLKAEQIKVYLATKNLIQVEGQQRKTQCQTLISAKITQDNGIELDTFDEAIADMNRIQDEILWGE